MPDVGINDKLLGGKSDNELSEGEVSLSRRCAALLAAISSLITVGITTQYASNTDASQTYLGGLDWHRLIFNYHPVFMVSGLLVCFVHAILAFTFLPFFSKPTKKIIHGILHGGACLFVVLGLTCVIVGNNDPDHNTGNTYYPNFFTLHSFVGLGTILLYFQNFFLGLLVFAFPIFDLPARKYYKPNHVIFGIITLFFALAAICSGVMELFTEYACGYAITSADTNPAENYHKMTKGCRSLNAIGIFAMLTVVCTTYAVLEIKPKP